MLHSTLLRRLGSALAMALLLQLALQGTGTPCARTAAESSRPHAAMRDMSAETSISSMAEGQPCRDVVASDDCRVPRSPAECTDTATCVSLAAVPEAPVVSAPDPALDASRPGAPPPLRSAPARTPEPPPPRG